jgi:hypothetical protein
MPTGIPVIRAIIKMKTLKYMIKSACFISRLTFIVISVLFANNMMATNNIPPQDSLSRIMTVAKVYEEKYSEPGSTQVTFYESARFYKILQSNLHYHEYIILLKEALKKQKPICIRFTKPNGDIIELVSKIKKPG